VIGRAIVFLCCSLIIFWISYQLKEHIEKSEELCELCGDGYRYYTWDYGNRKVEFTADEPFLNIIIQTAPRKTNHLLIETITKLLYTGFESQFDKQFGRSLQKINRSDDRLALFPFRITIINHHGQQHTAFQAARTIFSQFDGNLIRFIEGESEFVYETEKIAEKANQQFSHTLGYIKNNLKSKEGYLMIMEDDFELCSGYFQAILEALCQVHRRGGAGLYVGTGGSGFIIPNKAIGDYLMMLHNNQHRYIPHDILLQQCFLGKQTCFRQAQRNFVTDKIFMKHRGYASSTHHFKYAANQWQCHWRNPLTDHTNQIVFTKLAYPLNYFSN